MRTYRELGPKPFVLSKSSDCWETREVNGVNLICVCRVCKIGSHVVIVIMRKEIVLRCLCSCFLSTWCWRAVTIDSQLPPLFEARSLSPFLVSLTSGGHTAGRNPEKGLAVDYHTKIRTTHTVNQDLTMPQLASL